MSEPNTNPSREEEVLTAESRFHFDCHADLPCFTQCCRDVNIYLTPYDVLRMRRALGLGSREFLEKFTHILLDKTTHIPAVQLAMDDESLACQLVGDAGCTVYDDRPWACRLYPLDLADKEGKYRFMAVRDRCFGLGENRAWTVQQWLDDQGVAPYVDMELAFQQMIPPRFRPRRPVDLELVQVMFLVYDLDQFDRLLDDPHFRELLQIDDELIRRLQRDEETLLRYAFRYIRGKLDKFLEDI